METPVIKAVLYTDAGWDSACEYKVGGYGIHGFTYTDTPPKKGTGNPKVVPTNNGYEGPLDDKGKVVVGNKVTVGEYVDIIGGARNIRSSGEAELNAFMVGLDWLKGRSDITEAAIYCDAKYVTQGVTSHMEGWKANNWIRSNGTPPQYVDRWKVCHELWHTLNTNMKVSVHWIKGHNGHIGNDLADALATKGKSGIRNNPNFETITFVADAQGYWKADVEPPRLLISPRWYFDTIEEGWGAGGVYTVYTGCHGPKEKDPELLGKPYSDNHLAVIRVRSVPDSMKELRTAVASAPTYRLGKVVVCNLDNILSKKSLSEYERYKLNFHSVSPKEIYIVDCHGKLVLGEMKPQGQGYRMVNTWKTLERKLDDIRSGLSGYHFTDITDLIFDKHPKKDQFVISPSLTQKVKHLDVKAEFNLTIADEDKDNFVKKVRLVLGQDTLSRNNFSALAESIKRVSVVTWRESNQVGRYGTYIEMTNGDYGLWSRYEANYILVSVD